MRPGISCAEERRIDRAAMVFQAGGDWIAVLEGRREGTGVHYEADESEDEGSQDLVPAVPQVRGFLFRLV